MLKNLNPEMTVRIDGSYGEGGGQILRTTLALSSLLREEVQIYNIRKGRKIPGLQPQHLTCVEACREITNALLEGANLRSLSLKFSPKNLEGGDLSFDVARIKGSAGSVSLVLQAVLPALVLAQRRSKVVVFGGTHVLWSPPFDYLRDVFFPMVGKIGCYFKGDIKKWGWYPKGKGEVLCEVSPTENLSPLNLTERGKLKNLKGISAVSNLPLEIAQRQKNQAMKILKEKKIFPQIDIKDAPSLGKGTFFFLFAEFENSFAGFSSLGEIGKRAEKVAEEACFEFLKFMKTKAALDPHLADQLIPYLSLAEGNSTFTVSEITGHLLTNLWVVEQFLPVKTEVEGKEGQEGKIVLESSGIKQKLGI